MGRLVGVVGLFSLVFLVLGPSFLISGRAIYSQEGVLCGVAFLAWLISSFGNKILLIVGVNLRLFGWTAIMALVIFFINTPGAIEPMRNEWSHNALLFIAFLVSVLVDLLSSLYKDLPGPIR